MAKTQKEQPKFNVMSTHPDDFGSSRPDNFIATVLDELFALRPSSRKKEGQPFPSHHLYVNLTFEMEDGSEYKESVFVTTILDMNDPSKINYAPSPDQAHLAGPDDANTVDDYIALATGQAEIEDGKEDEYQGPYCVGYGTKIPQGACWQLHETFKVRLEEDGQDTEFLRTQRSDVMKGYKLQFARLDQDPKIKRSPKEGEKDQNFKVLSVVDIVESPKKSKKASKEETKSTTSKTTKKDSAKDDDDIESLVENAVLALLPEDNSSVTKKSILPEVLNALGDQKGQGIKLMNNMKWLNSTDRPWFSNEDGSVQMSEE
jgi:hypothetical protein